jgi:hypothetical protein
MLLIPNYPYYVTFFYTTLGVFFTCLLARENHDIFYTVSLPIQKRDMVKARIWLVVIIELAQVVVSIPFAFIRQSYPMPGNQVGMDANIALLGLSLVQMAVFNFVFFVKYYKNPDKVGRYFAIGATIEFIVMGIMLTCDHAVPFCRDVLDTKDPKNCGWKLLVLAIGIAFFAVMNLLAYHKASKSFEGLDL